MPPASRCRLASAEGSRHISSFMPPAGCCRGSPAQAVSAGSGAQLVLPVPAGGHPRPAGAPAEAVPAGAALWQPLTLGRCCDLLGVVGNA